MFRPQSSLMPSSTLTTFRSTGPPELAAFDESDIGPILSLLSRCPEEGMLTRVFQQHGFFGTCWYDSAVMMIFESSAGKKIFLPLLEQCFTILLKNGIHDLSYTHAIKLTDEEFELEKKFSSNPEPFFTSESHKTELLARELKKFTNSSADDLFWEVLAHSLQKYLLLGYLFHKNPPKANAKILSERRKSWNASSFESLHSCLRSASGMSVQGALDEQTVVFIKGLSRLLQELSKGECSIEEWDTNKLEETHGYYLIVGTNSYGGGHVVSMYKCNGRWSLFNNNYGTIPLSDEDSHKIDTIGIEALSLRTDVGTKTLTSLFTLKDKTTIDITVPYSQGAEDTNFNYFKKHVSFAFICKKAATEGGRIDKGRKKRQSKTKKARKQKRKTYKK